MHNDISETSRCFLFIHVKQKSKQSTNMSVAIQQKLKLDTSIIHQDDSATKTSFQVLTGYSSEKEQRAATQHDN